MYKIYLILFLAFIVPAGNTSAQDKNYRIEILVFRHLQHEAKPFETMELRDFSDSLDFLTPPKPEEGGDSELGSPLETGELPEQELAEEEPWADVVHIEDKSEVMQDAWRRLRLSAPFRPEQYLSWVQSPNEPFPFLRIHNLEVVFIDDPYDEQGAELAALAEAAADAGQPMVFSDQGDALPGDPEQEPELPEPTLFHQIDGTVMLKRSRFLHLKLDLEMREAVYDENALTQDMIAREAMDSAELEVEEAVLPVPSSFLVHSLQQSRQVKSERMEYFDGPVISVLAYISSVEIEEPMDADGNLVED